MRIQDAEAGDVLRDKDGDVWVVFGAHSAVCVVQVGEPQWELRGGDSMSAKKAEAFGPFTRLVPEKETP